MTLASLFTLFVSMLVLAVIPGPGIFAVVARTSAGGFRHGVSTSLGILAGDFVFITLALLGLTALSELLGGLFVFVKYFGAAYLVWLGVSIIKSGASRNVKQSVRPANHLASFSAGLITTLGNPKAILFYLSFFPTLFDLSHVTLIDAFALYAIVTIAVGGVMLAYAYVAFKAKTRYQAASGGSYFKYGAGAMLVSSGLYVAART